MVGRGFEAHHPLGGPRRRNPPSDGSCISATQGGEESKRGQFRDAMERGGPRTVSLRASLGGSTPALAETSRTGARANRRPEPRPRRAALAGNGSVRSAVRFLRPRAPAVRRHRGSLYRIAARRRIQALVLHDAGPQRPIARVAGAGDALALPQRRTAPPAPWHSISGAALRRGRPVNALPRHLLPAPLSRSRI